VLLATAHKGRSNVMPMSWHLMMEFEPPLVGCIVSNRNHSFGMLKASRECTLNVPQAELLGKVVKCGNASGRSMDKFAKFGLTAAAAARVKAPLVAECYANLECKLVDTRLVEKYNFFVLRVVKAWIERPRTRRRTIHHLGWGRFMIAGKTVKTSSRMR